MLAKRLLKRIVSLLLMTLVTFVLLTVIRVEATPIRPDVRKVLAEPQPSPDNFSPARAGWNGPETASSAQPVNTTYEQLSPATTARNVHESLIAAALPDYRALAAILLVILLLRRIRKAYQKARVAAAPTFVPAGTNVAVPTATSDSALIVEGEPVVEKQRVA